MAIDHRPFHGDRAAHEAAIDVALRRAEVEIVCLAGYMRLLTPLLVDAWQGRMLNIHPSLLPAFPGLDTHARALAAGVRLHGCTVHLVTQATDEGPILAQEAVMVFDDDTEELLSAYFRSPKANLAELLAKALGYRIRSAAKELGICEIHFKLGGPEKADWSIDLIEASSAVEPPATGGSV